MDNITHSLIGIAVAEEAVQYRIRTKGAVSKTAHICMWIVSWAANNLPDLDFFYAPITPGPLGYLLHHRGHTHTIVSLLPQAILLMIPVYLFHLWKKSALNKNDFIYLWILASFGILIHIFLDSLNSYGVHPFWPFNNNWYYDDSVFIVEPLIWVSILPVLVQLTPWRVPRFFFVFLWCVGLALLWFTGFVPYSLAFGATAWGGLLYWIIRGFRPLNRIFATSGALFVVLFTFIATSRLSKAIILDSLPTGPWIHLDTIASPMPANPFCWSILEIQKSITGDRYRAIRALVAPFPGVREAKYCDLMPRSAGTAEIKSFPFRSTPSVHFLGYFEDSATDLRNLSASNCFVADYLKFARAPFVKQYPKSLLLGDLRYDRSKGTDFAEVSAPLVPINCPRNIPNWVPPRSDLLQSTP